MWTDVKIAKLIKTYRFSLCRRMWKGVFHSTHAASIYCYKGSLDNYDVFPLTNVLPLLNSTCYNSSRQTAWYTFGFNGKVDGPATTAVLSAFIATQSLNVLLLNWEKEAANGTLGLQLSYALSAVPNAKIVGDDCGMAITKLGLAGFNTKQLHLSGHSLGAHLMAFAAAFAKDNGYIIAHLTAMDPARQLFEGPSGMNTGVNPFCALFVDVIHTDCGPGGYGITRPAGTADMWPNNGGKITKQPGCPIGTFGMFTSQDLCSHDRSWQLFAESIYSPTAFPAASAPDYDSWARDPASWTNITYMGYSVSTSASGNYFLSTGATSPYGLGLRGLTPNASQTSG